MKTFVRAVAALGAAAFLSGICMGSAASAAVYDLTVTGTMVDVTAFHDYGEVPPPPMTIGVGDSFSLNASFDTAGAVLDSWWDASPIFNVYMLQGASIQLSIGSYATSFSVSGPWQAVFNLMNNAPDGLGELDGQFFELTRSDYLQPSFPIEWGTPDDVMGQSLYFHAYDPTATARDNDLITSVAPLSAFSDQKLFVNFWNYSLNSSVQFRGDVTSSTLTQRGAVPEPASWALMIGGLALAGGMMRRRRVSVAFG